MKKLIGAVVCIASFALFAGMAIAANGYNTLNYIETGGARWSVGGTLNILTGGVFSYNGVSQPVIRTAVDAVANGQTSKAVTVTGVTTLSRCVAQSNEVSTNSVYIRAAVPTADTVTVTTSGDPGASALDITVICAN